MVPLYNRNMTEAEHFRTLPMKLTLTLSTWGWEAATRVLWSCGHLLNCFVFPGDSNIKPTHPTSGELPWSHEDADLSQSLLVSLSASTKTAISVNDQFIYNRLRAAGPVGFLAVASKPDESLLGINEAPFPKRAVTYSQASDDDTKTWIRSLMKKEKLTRALTMDFGGRGDSLNRIHVMLTALNLSVTTLAVGSEPKLYTPQEMAESRAEIARLKKVQSNASGQRSAAMAQIGEGRCFEEMFEEWGKFRARGCFPGMVLKWADGLAEVEGALKGLCDGTAVTGGKNLIFRL